MDANMENGTWSVIGLWLHMEEAASDVKITTGDQQKQLVESSKTHNTCSIEHIGREHQCVET